MRKTENSSSCRVTAIGCLSAAWVCASATRGQPHRSASQLNDVPGSECSVLYVNPNPAVFPASYGPAGGLVNTWQILQWRHTAHVCDGPKKVLKTCFLSDSWSISLGIGFCTTVKADRELSAERLCRGVLKMSEGVSDTKTIWRTFLERFIAAIVLRNGEMS